MRLGLVGPGLADARQQLARRARAADAGQHGAAAQRRQARRRHVAALAVQLLGGLQVARGLGVAPQPPLGVAGHVLQVGTAARELGRELLGQAHHRVHAALEHQAQAAFAQPRRGLLRSAGAAKRRWLRLPPGTAIDARDVDAWRFPPGTQLWKEFAVAGRPVETRYIERRRDGRWIYATYAWNADGTDADLVPARGEAAWPVAGAPGGRYALPSVADCHACHESAAVPVLGFSAVQLSPARVPTDLRTLVAARRLRGLPARLLAAPPRVAATPEVERAALGYLHANCGHCHNRSGHQAPLALTLAQRAADPQASRAEVLASTVNAASRFRMPDAAATLIAPGDPARSLLVQRMATREPRLQMPPLGTVVPDPEGLALLRRWIAQEPHVAEFPPRPTAPERRDRP